MRINGKFAVLPMALVAAFALSACKDKQPEPAMPEQPMPTTPATPTTPQAPPAAPVDRAGDAAMGEVTVTDVKLGKAVDADQRVTMPTEMFAPHDTIYASVMTNGSAEQVMLSARWLYDGDQEVNESTETIAPTGPATTTFHIEKSDGWPVGDYSVEISLDGEVVNRHSFTVQEGGAQE